MISYDKFRDSLRLLQEQHDNYVHRLESVPRWVRPAVEESVIQRFETCYDSLHKVLRRHLIEVVGIAEVSIAPMEIFRKADATDLLPSEFSQWETYNKLRVGTTHDYSGEKARRCLDIVPEFLIDASALYETLTAGAWA